MKKPILQPLSSVIEEEVAIGFSSSTATHARVTISVIPCSGLNHICARIIPPNKKIYFFLQNFHHVQEKTKKALEILVVSLRTKKRDFAGDVSTACATPEGSRRSFFGRKYRRSIR